MKAILYVVAILVAGGAAYFTLEHSRKFDELQKDRLKTIKTDKEVSANADVKEKELKDAKAELASSEQKREEVTQSISALKSSGATLERDVAELGAARPLGRIALEPGLRPDVRVAIGARQTVSLAAVRIR